MQGRSTLFLFLLFGWMTACGGGAHSDPAPVPPDTTVIPPVATPPAAVISAITVQVVPERTELSTGGRQTFKAEVSGEAHPGVLWKIKEGEQGG
ncbi:MAG TPA: hypothetical protein VFA47_00440, partial [Candidatus Manganitrophaceae bacterium]|nr:hypothetical protein [Candidatus Manganitrophaceae bacterium]